MSTPNENGRQRNAFLTVMNYTEAQFEAVCNNANKHNYLVIGKEICPETDTPHFHVYVEFKNPRRVTAIRKEFSVYVPNLAEKPPWLALITLRRAVTILNSAH